MSITDAQLQEQMEQEAQGKGQTVAQAEARVALVLATKALEDAQKAVTAALVPLAALEAERDPDGARLASSASEARSHVMYAQRMAEALRRAVEREPAAPCGIAAQVGGAIGDGLSQAYRGPQRGRFA